LGGRQGINPGIGGVCLNADLCRQAAEKVGNPNILINMVSRRVRQLTTGGGGGNRPLVTETATQGAGDIALREVCEEKIGYEMIEDTPAIEPPGRKRKRA